MITKDEIEKLAEMARISMTDGEKESLREDIDGILDYVSQINKAHGDTKGDGWEPSARNVTREDVVTNKGGEYTDPLLKAAPKSEGGYVKVKKIL